MGGTLVVTLKLARAVKWFDVVWEQRKHLATTNCQVFFHHFWWLIPLAAIEPSPAEPEPKVHYRLRRAGTLLYQGFAPNPTYYAPKIFV